MSDDTPTLELFYDNWKIYHNHLRVALSYLQDDDLKLTSHPDLRPIGMLAQHIIAARVYWFHVFLGEGDNDLTHYRTWDDDGTPLFPISKVLQGLDDSWEFVWGCLQRWSADDLQKTFPRERRGHTYDLSRSWVIWHVLEHDLHHGGEISLTLGMHGRQAPDI